MSYITKEEVTKLREDARKEMYDYIKKIDPKFVETRSYTR